MSASDATALSSQPDSRPSPKPGPSSGAGPVVVLIGPPGSGKSTVATELARQLGVPSRDTDADVERLAGKPISAIFIDEGEPAFRALERAAVVAALAEHRGVLALGGGAVLDERTQADLARHTVVFLEVSLAAAAPRVGFSVARPLLVGNPRARWAELMQARRPVYQRLATLVVSTDSLTPREVAAEIAAYLASSGTRASGEAT